MKRPFLSFVIASAVAGLFAQGCGADVATSGPAKMDLPSFAPTGDPDGDPHAAAVDHDGRGGRERPPLAREGRAAPFPAVHASSLKNGLIVAVLEAHALPIVQVRVVVRAGAGYAPKQPGLASITAQLLKDGGTRTMTSAELLRRVEGLGANLSIDVDADATTIGTGVTTSHFDEAVALLGEMVLAPRFDDAELGKLKSRESDDAEAQLRSSGQFTATRTLFRELYPAGSPYASFGMVPSDIAKINGAAIRDFHRKFYVAKNMTVVVAGDVNEASARARVEKVFGAAAGGEAPTIDFPAPVAPTKRRVIVAHRPKSAQSDVYVVGLGPARVAPEWADVRVCNQIFGGGVASRLFTDVREQRSLAYTARSSILELAHGAQPVVAYAGTQTAKTADAVTGILENEERLLAAPASTDEALGARRYLSDIFAVRMETVGAIADMTADLASLGLPFEYWDTYRAAVRATTASSASAVAGSMLHPAAALIVVAGDADVIGPSLTRFGEVTVVDPERQFSTIGTPLPEKK